jgi:anti-sigma B factor antagonist
MINRRDQGNYLICSFGERVMLDDSHAVTVRDELRAAADAATKTLVIDLGNVDYMTSAIIGVLVSLFRQLQKRGIEMRVAAANEEVNNVLAISRLNSVFKCFDTVEAATAGA